MRLTGLLLLLSSANLLAKEIDQPYRSVDFAGRGNSGITTAADEDALFFNPANTARGEKNPGFKVIFPGLELEATSNLSELSSVAGDNAKLLRYLQKSQGKAFSFGLNEFTGAAFSHFSFGFFASMQGNFFIFKDPFKTAIETFDLNLKQNQGIVGGSSISFLDEAFKIGAAAKAINRKETKAQIALSSATSLKDAVLSDFQNSGNGIGLDLAASYQPKYFLDPQVALTIQDLGDTHFTQPKKSVKVSSLRQSVNLGMSLSASPGFGLLSTYFEIWDLLRHKDPSMYKNIHLGLSYMMWDVLVFNTGINQGYPTVGASLKGSLFSLDLGSYTEEIGDRVGQIPSERYFVKVGIAYVFGQDKKEMPDLPEAYKDQTPKKEIVVPEMRNSTINKD